MEYRGKYQQYPNILGVASPRKVAGLFKWVPSGSEEWNRNRRLERLKVEQGIVLQAQNVANA